MSLHWNNAHHKYADNTNNKTTIQSLGNIPNTRGQENESLGKKFATSKLKLTKKRMSTCPPSRTLVLQEFQPQW